MPEIELTHTITSTAAVIRLNGELDLVTAKATAAVLYQATDTLPPPRQIVLDLTDLDFLLMAGLRVIHSFAGCCAERAMWTCLVAKPGSTVRRIIDLNLIRPHLPTFDSVEEALESDG